MHEHWYRVATRMGHSRSPMVVVVMLVAAAVAAPRSVAAQPAPDPPPAAAPDATAEPDAPEPEDAAPDEPPAAGEAAAAVGPATVSVAAAAAEPAPGDDEAVEGEVSRDPAASAAAPAGEDGFSPARELPDYDGREDSTSGGDVLLWIPRLVFAPIYLVTEFVIRRPLGWLVSAGERAQLPALLVDFFTFGPERNTGLIPTFLVDFGFQPSVGLYFFADDVGARGHQIRIRGATWGADWLTLSLTDRLTIARETTLGFRAEGTRRKDWLYYGMGPDASSANESRYSRDSLEAALVLTSSFWRASTLRVTAGIRRVRFDGNEACCGEASIAQRIAEGPGGWNDERHTVTELEPGVARLTYPDGFFGGYFIYRQAIDVALDSRRVRPENGSGFRVAASAEHAFSLEEPARQRWLRWGGALGGFFDVSGRGHVIGLSVAAYFADPLGADETIPFTEQVMVGGNVLLRGFVEGFLVDRSAIAATIEYRYPIWVFLDGTVQAAFGNVFGEHLDGFELDRLRGSFTLGIRALTRPDHSLDLAVGFGTEPIDQGFEIDSVRFVIGATAGF